MRRAPTAARRPRAERPAPSAGSRASRAERRAPGAQSRAPGPWSPEPRAAGAQPGAERLQKILSTAGVASRRAAEQLILDGRVSVNGQTVTALGTKADPERDDVRVDGRRVRPPARHRYILLNKPAGVVSTRSDPRRRRTVLDLLHGVAEYLYPVGRLDFESEGLLLLTNDGDLAAALTHPRHGIVKVYEAIVRGWPDERALTRLRRGIVLDDRRTAPAEVALVRAFTASGHHERALLEIGLREGRNRQVRRMCEAVGHPVERLSRVRIGPISDRRMKPGMWRDLTDSELRALRAATTSAPLARVSPRSPTGD